MALLYELDDAFYIFHRQNPRVVKDVKTPEHRAQRTRQSKNGVGGAIQGAASAAESF